MHTRFIYTLALCVMQQQTPSLRMVPEAKWRIRFAPGIEPYDLKQL